MNEYELNGFHLRLFWKIVKELVEFGIWEHVEVRYSGYFRFIPVQVEVFEVCKSSWMCSGSILFKGILFQNWS